MYEKILVLSRGHRGMCNVGGLWPTLNNMSNHSRARFQTAQAGHCTESKLKISSHHYMLTFRE